MVHKNVLNFGLRWSSLADIDIQVELFENGNWSKNQLADLNQQQVKHLKTLKPQRIQF